MANYSALLQKSRINNETVVKDDLLYFVIDNNVIGSSGNFITFTGLPKSSKSTFICAFIASAISGRSVYDFNVLRYPHLNKRRVALFDTEQSPYDFQNKAKLIKRLSLVNDIYKDLDVYSVIEYDAIVILNMINTYLKENSDVAILIIDGILDLIDNFNDERQAKRLIKIIRRWAKKHEILIVTVLHLGKKDNMALGHIGSASSRYCQSELEVIKNKDSTFTLQPRMLRSAGNFNPINIYYSTVENTFLQV